MHSFPRPPALVAPGGVTLRALRAGDVAPFVAAFREDPALRAAIGAGVVPTPSLVRRLVAGQDRERVRGRRIDLAIADARDGFAGSAGLHGVDWEAGRAEVGFWVAPAARRRGVGSAAVELLAEWALGAAGLVRLELATSPGNAAARALARRTGFAEAGEVRREGPGGRALTLVLHVRTAAGGQRAARGPG